MQSSRRLLHKVAVLGANGGIGQPLSLLLKLNPRVSTLALADIVGTPGVAADLSHIDTPAQVSGHLSDCLAEALKGSDLVLIPAGVPRKPGMSRDDLFNTNASIVASLADACAQHCPNAHIGIISNPVNSTVPIAAEILKKHGAFNARKLYGVTTLDVLRANTFIGELHKKSGLDVTVVGGHSGVTILPLLSQTGFTFSEEQIKALTHRIQFGGDEVVKAKDGAGSATLSMAVAAQRFAEAILKALDGETSNICTFVQQPDAEAGYFSNRCDITKDGVSKIYPIGEMSAFEQEAHAQAVAELKKNVKKGEEFAKTF